MCIFYLLVSEIVQLVEKRTKEQNAMDGVGSRRAVATDLFISLRNLKCMNVFHNYNFTRHCF